MTEDNGDRSDRRPETYRDHLRLSAQLQLAQIESRLQMKFGASDIVQDAMVKAHTRLEQFRGRTQGEFVAWLQRIVRNVLIDRIRHFTGPRHDARLERSLDRIVESSRRLEEWLAAEQPSPSQKALRREEVERLARSLSSLPDDQHEVLVLKYYLGWPLGRIAEHAGRTRASVAGLLRRGLARLRHELLEEDP